MVYGLIFVANFLVGISIGISGVAGFLLPMFYTGVLAFSVAESMSLSFGAFFISGVIGTVQYHKTKDIDFKFCGKLAIGSILGSLLGVWVNQAIPVVTAKQCLYIMVLVSGASLFMGKKDGAETILGTRIKSNSLCIMALGLAVSLICAFTGAGGPILSVPLLCLLGFTVRQAVGMSLFNSIFIAIPAFLGYVGGAMSQALVVNIFVALVSHGIGIFIGAKVSGRINQKILKQTIAVIAIGVAIYMLYQTLI